MNNDFWHCLDLEECLRISAMLVLRCCLAALTSVSTAVFAADEAAVWIPKEVSDCLRQSGGDDSRILINLNPFYLRGDFDGDRRVDLAIGIRGQTGRDSGILFCNADGSIHTIGQARLHKARSSPGFSENVFPADWQVLSRSAALAERKENLRLPPVLSGIRGEGVLLIWRDEAAIVYWNGAGYRFSGLYQ